MQAKHGGSGAAAVQAPEQPTEGERADAAAELAVERIGNELGWTAMADVVVERDLAASWVTVRVRVPDHETDQRLARGDG